MVAALVITAAMIFGLAVLYLLQIQSVSRTLEGQLRSYAAEIAQSAARTGTWPAFLPPSTLDANAEAQVTAADGHVLAATRTLAGLPAVYALTADATTPVRLKAAEGALPNDVIVVGIRQSIAGQPVTIITGTPTTLLTQLRSAFTSNLLLGLPAILLFAAAAVWLIVGRALRPVDRIRQAVTAITSADLSQRVPDEGPQDEIGNLAHTMNDMLQRLEDAARRQRRFVADASHELRSPLSAIRTTLEVGLAHPDQAPWPLIARRAAQQATRLQDLVQELLLLAKADERILALQPERVDVAWLLRELTASSPRGHVDVRLQLSGDAVTSGNPDDLTRLFRNIIDNALRYATSTVGITTHTAHDRLIVEITDDGPGIPAADQDRIFHRFVRLDSSRERATGTTGLGLAIAREIALAHHGDIRLADAADPADADADADADEGGSRFIVTLPTADPGSSAATRPTTAPDPRTAT